jgi:hypothetical protein
MMTMTNDDGDDDDDDDVPLYLVLDWLVLRGAHRGDYCFGPQLLLCVVLVPTMRL